MRDRSKTSQNRGWVKAKVVRRGGGGFEGVTTPAPRKIIIIHMAYCHRITYVHNDYIFRSYIHTYIHTSFIYYSRFSGWQLKAS